MWRQRRHTRRLRRRPSLREVRIEALLKAGDGRVYVVGSPLGPPAPKTRHLEPMPAGSHAGRARDPSALPINITVVAMQRALRRSISPYIYGVNEYGYSGYGELQQAIKDAGIGFVRRGGDIDSRYNWEVDTKNSAADWYFENFPQAQQGSMTSVDLLFQTAKRGGADAVFTVPVLGWLPKAREHSCVFSVGKYGQQRAADPWSPDCGNGQTPNGTYITWHNVSDTAALFGPDHQGAFVSRQVQRWGGASQGGVRFYCLDNEPVWWSYVHWDIHPAPSSYDEILQRHVAYAAAVKAADPGAQLLGPVSGGWSDVFYSITDMQSGWRTPPWKYWSNPVDRNAHEGVPFLKWYMQQMRKQEYHQSKPKSTTNTTTSRTSSSNSNSSSSTTTRLLDVVDIHAYVAGSTGSDATDSASQATRVAATRIYWDPTFNCSSTICDWADPVTAPDGVPRFLVRVQEMIAEAYPGLGLAVTEYSFGGNNDASGAVAQAEALGVFGKLGVTLATVFPGPKAATTVYQAFKMFGNYDSLGGKFGNVGVSAESSDVWSVSSYAAINTKRRVLTVLLINLTPFQQDVEVSLDFVPAREIKCFRYDSANLTAIVPLAPIPAATSISLTLTGYSLTMLEAPTQ